MGDPVITITDENRHLYGGDYAITRTVPATHPKTGMPLPGTRDSIRGASRYYRSFYKGDIIYVHDPTKEFNFCLWNNDGTSHSRDFFMLLKREKGFHVCEYQDWDLAPDLIEIYEVENGQIILRGGNDLLGRPFYEVLMYRTKERFLEEEKALQVADSVQQYAQGKIAGVVDDKQVRVMESQIEVMPHTFDPSVHNEMVKAAKENLKNEAGG